MQASFWVKYAGPLVSIQDQGRYGYMRYGVPYSGPMDKGSFCIAHAAIGNPCTNAALEISLGGVELHCTGGSVTLAVAGGSFNVDINGVRYPSWLVYTVGQGAVISIRPGTWGSWCYLAFAGDLQHPAWLGSQSTHLASALCGKAIQTGDNLYINNASTRSNRQSILPTPEFATNVQTIRVVPGPQARYFTDEANSALLTSRFTITRDYDRMGMRLEGIKLDIHRALDMPSEALVRGSVQVPGQGDPIVLLADHQTTGGYPKIATVISADQDRLVQNRQQESITFTSVTPGQAIVAARRRQAEIHAWIDRIPGWSGTLDQRLLRHNLISGVSASD